MANMFVMLTDVQCSHFLPKLIHTFLPVPAAGTQVFRPTCETQDQSPAERRERERRTRGQQKRAKTLQPLLSSTETKEEGLKTKPELSLENQGYHLTSLM